MDHTSSSRDPDDRTDAQENVAADHPLDEPPNGGSDPDPAASDPGPIEVWQRWRGRSDAPFHAYCEILPRSSEDDPRNGDEWIEYTWGVARVVLKYTPVFVFLAAAYLVVMAELSSGAVGIGQFLQGTRFEGLLLEAVVGLVWVVVLAALLAHADVIPNARSLRPLFVYGLFFSLLAGVAASIYRSSIVLQRGAAGGQIGAPGDIVVWSGFLLTLFLGGQLVYDGMLRTENMFSRLHEKNPPIIGPVDIDSYDDKEELRAAFREAACAYRENFLSEFDEALTHTLGCEDSGPSDALPPIPTVYVFSVVFVAPFFVTGLTLASEAHPGDLAYLLGFVAPAVLNVVLVVVFFQFLVLIKYFNRLLTEHSPYADDAGRGFTLQYQFDHPDGYAGFRDMGKFATRVNTILFVGGIFVAYRIYVAGLPALGAKRAGTSTQEMLLWGFNYLGPLLVYALAVIVWIYFSFWQIHKTMRRGRSRRIRRSISDEYDGELQDGKRALRRAPTWPLNVRAFASLVIGDMLPLLSLLPLIQP